MEPPVGPFENCHCEKTLKEDKEKINIDKKILNIFLRKTKITNSWIYEMLISKNKFFYQLKRV